MFREYADRWLRDSTPHLKARTAEAYRSILDLHLIPAFGPRPLASLTSADVRSFAAEKLRAKIARNTVKNLVATLRTIGYQAVEDGLIPSNPAARFGKVFSVRHDPKAHVVALDEAGVGQVLAAAVKWFPEYELAVRTLFLTGMREGELLGLKWEDFDWPHNLIELRRSVAQRQGRLIVNTPKSGKLRTVDIPASLTARLRERFEVRQTAATMTDLPFSEWVFPAQTDPAKPMNDAWFRDRVWRKLLELAKVRHLRVHDARHTYASIMLRRGVPMAYVSRQLGHSSIQITVDLYGHFEAGADRHQVEGFAAAVDEQETRAPAPGESLRTPEL
jgi:integrase